MTLSNKNVVFDVVGTCMSYDAVVNAVEKRLGERLRSECIKPQLLVFAWFEAAEREYTYLSISHRYRGFNDVFRGLFFRMLWMAGIGEPRSFASDEDLDYIMGETLKLTARPGIDECFRILRDGGFTVWAYSMDTVKDVSGYFENNGIAMSIDNIMSCDSGGVGKPDPKAYHPLLEKFAGGEAWFAAAHMWDVSAAKSTG